MSKLHEEQAAGQPKDVVVVVDMSDDKANAQGGDKPPKAEEYKIQIDREHYTVDVPEMTGRELLLKAEKVPPDNYMILRILHGGKSEPIGLDEHTSFTDPGLERFITLPKDQTEGSGETPLRRQFNLGDMDVQALEARGVSWEAIIEGNQRWLVIHNYPVTVGYNHATVQAAFIIGTTYPDTQIDMVYFYPDLQRKDGGQIRALAPQSFDGKTWQRWSRHRTPQNPWRIGLDNIDTHLQLVDYWLTREFAA